MSTNINVVVGDEAVLQRARQQQAANRQANLENASSKDLEQKALAARTSALAEQSKDAAGDPLYGVPSEVPEIGRRPGARRVGRGGVVAAQLELTTLGSKFRLKVGSPNFAVSTTKEIEAQTASIANPSLPPNFQIVPPQLPVLGNVSQFRSTGQFLWFTAGTPTISPTAPPASATTQVGNSSVSNRTASEDRRYMLPLGKDSALLIYVVNRLRLRFVYSLVQEDLVTAENARSRPPTTQFSSIVTYDQKRVSQTTKTLFSSETFSDYFINCFFVAKKSVKQIETPAVLEAAVRRVCPPLTANSTVSIQSIYGRSERYSGDGAGAGNSYFITFPDIMTTEPTIDLQAWRNSGLYGDYNPANQTLALHFGLLTADTSYLSRFFTPSAFAFIKGSLVINNNSAGYPYMRTNFFPNAPFLFLEQCRVLTLVDGQQLPASCQGTRADFDVTSVQPATIDETLDSSNFRRNGNYAVELNGSTFALIGNQLLYAWNWDTPASCLAEALSLGFPPASLRP